MPKYIYHCVIMSQLSEPWIKGYLFLTRTPFGFCIQYEFERLTKFHFLLFSEKMNILLGMKPRYEDFVYIFMGSLQN